MRVVLAALASVGVHAAVFGAFAGRAPATVAVAVPAADAVEVEVFRLAPAREPETERTPELPERSRPPARAKAKAAAAAPAGSVGAAPVESVPVAPAEAPPVDSAQGALEPAPPVPKAPAAPALDTTALSRRLQEVAARCYPAAARRFRQTGEAEVRFCLDAAGALAESTVSRSSGSDLLDRAASGCVVSGAAPYGAQAHGHCFTVPVRFGH